MDVQGTNKDEKEPNPSPFIESTYSKSVKPKKSEISQTEVLKGNISFFLSWTNFVHNKSWIITFIQHVRDKRTFMNSQYVNTT